MTDIDQMLSNHKADSWSDVSEDDDALYDDESADPLTRLEAYIDHCFETYDVVGEYLDRDQVQCCVADWGRRRGQARYHTEMQKQEFGKRVSDSAHRKKVKGTHAMFVATALIGVEPEDDNGAGWKACARHELGHLIDYEKHGKSSGHGRGFKWVMSQFGEETNDGQHAHGYPPRTHR